MTSEVAYTYNPSYLEGRDLVKGGLRPVGAELDPIPSSKLGIAT
jgi:hypothetical protein